MPTETPNIRTRATSFFPGVRWVAVFVVLAAIGLCVSPRFSRGSQRAQDATLADCLRYLRTQTFLYAAQHNNIPPGFPGNDIMLAPDAQAFVEQMTQYTNAYGRPSRNREPGFNFGPYLLDLPANPITLRTGVLVVTGKAMPAPDESQSYGWIYNPRTRQIVANAGGADPHGVAYASY